MLSPQPCQSLLYSERAGIISLLCILQFTVLSWELGTDRTGVVSEGQVWKLTLSWEDLLVHISWLFPGAADSDSHLSPLKSQFCVLLPYLMS